MTNQPQKMMDDPVWGEAFREWASEERAPQALSKETRLEVAALLALGTASAVSATTAAAAATNGGLSGVTASSALGAAGVASGGSVVATTTMAGAGTVLGATASAVTGASIAPVGGSAMFLSMGALGLVPKMILSVCVAGSVVAGGSLVDKALRSRDPAPEIETPRPDGPDPQAALPVATPHDSQMREKTPSSDRVADHAAETAPVNDKLTAARRQTQAPTELRPRDRIGQVSSTGDGVETTNPSALADEVALLREVRRVLPTDQEKAWQLLERYHARHPNGALRSEYEALVVRAQQPLGAP
jgi:hypothetical protein